MNYKILVITWCNMGDNHVSTHTVLEYDNVVMGEAAYRELVAARIGSKSSYLEIEITKLW